MASTRGATGPTHPAPGRRAELRRAMLHLVGRTTSMLVLLTTAFYLWPERVPATDTPTALRMLGTVLALGLVAVVVRAQVRALREEGRPLAQIEALLATLYLIVVVFAAGYHQMASHPGQITGLETKTDALYFTVTVVATVGFGDIHAVGQLARAVVTAQMLFSLLYIGSAVRVLGRLWPDERLRGTM